MALGCRVVPFRETPTTHILQQVANASSVFIIQRLPFRIGGVSTNLVLSRALLDLINLILCCVQATNEVLVPRQNPVDTHVASNNLPFWFPFRAIEFWIYFGRPLVYLRLSFACFWQPFETILGTFGSVWAPKRQLKHHQKVTNISSIYHQNNINVTHAGMSVSNAPPFHRCY